MKKLQKFKGFLAAIVIAATALSCSDDDKPSGTKVRYHLIMQSDIATEINFFNASGTLIGVSQEMSGAEWGKTEYVDKPFDAFVSADFSNQELTPQTYQLRIFVDDEVVAEESGTVNPGIATSATLTYTVE